MRSSTLLLVDAVINLVLGILLLLFPRGVVDLLGLPDTESKFYPNILGAVLFGIGIALLIESYKSRADIAGLGLAGAIAINLSGGVVLALWLVFGELSISTNGFMLLGTLALVLVAVSGLEWWALWQSKLRASSSAPIRPPRDGWGRALSSRRERGRRELRPAAGRNIQHFDLRQGAERHFHPDWVFSSLNSRLIGGGSFMPVNASSAKG